MLSFLFSLFVLSAHATQTECEFLMTPAERERALALELNRLNPSQNVVSTEGIATLARLSRDNLQHMIHRLNESYPVQEVPSEFAAMAETSVKNLYFHFLQNAHQINGVTHIGPQLSPREMVRRGLSSSNEISDSLVAPYATSPWEVLVADKRSSLESLLRNILTSDKLSLDDTLADESGFIIPNLVNPMDYFDFFDLWDPALGEQVFELNRAHLPRQFSSYAEFRHALDNENVGDYFPPHLVNERLAPFHRHLNRYILSVPDARIFLATAFLRWAFYLHSLAPEEAFGLLENSINQKAPLLSIIERRVFPFLFMPKGMTLRLPLGVNPADYSIIRYIPPRNDLPQFGGFSGMRRIGGPNRP